MPSSLPQELTLAILLDKNNWSKWIFPVFSRLNATWWLTLRKTLLTRSGYEKLVKELELLSRVERPQIVQEILEAAQEGGIKENPEFQLALAQRQRVERRIKQLQQTLANAEVLVGSNLSPDKVRFNSRVRVLNLATGREQEFKLVEAVEADAAAHALSLSSPLGQALLGRSPGDRVQVQAPGGTRIYQVLEIRMGDL